MQPYSMPYTPTLEENRDILAFFDKFFGGLFPQNQLRQRELDLAMPYRRLLLKVLQY